MPRVFFGFVFGRSGGFCYLCVMNSHLYDKPGLGDFVVVSAPSMEQDEVMRFLEPLMGRMPRFTLRFEHDADMSGGVRVIVRRPLILHRDKPAFITADFRRTGDYELAERFLEALREVIDPDGGDIVMQSEEPPVLKCASPGRLRRILRDFVPDNDAACYAVEEDGAPEPSLASPLLPEPEDEEEPEADLSLEEEKKRWLDQLSALVLQYVSVYREMPPMERINEIIRGKLSLEAEGLSSIHVNGDMRIFLPEYNEIELRLTPLPRTLYLLFLLHPEGIVLKDIGRYRRQLGEIYSMVMPGRDERVADAVLDGLTVPGSDSLRQKLSQIKSGVNRYVTNGRLAATYCVSGERGKAYRIELPAERIHLPEALRRVASMY